MAIMTDGAAGRDLREPRFERRPWERVSQGSGQPFAVNLWIGLNALVVSVTMPGVEPDDVRLAVHGARLSLQGPAGTPCGDVDLPYAVDIPPLLVKDGKDTLYILLQRK